MLNIILFSILFEQFHKAVCYIYVFHSNRFIALPVACESSRQKDKRVCLRKAKRLIPQQSLSFFKKNEISSKRN